MAQPEIRQRFTTESVWNGSRESGHWLVMNGFMRFAGQNTNVIGGGEQQADIEENMAMVID